MASLTTEQRGGKSKYRLAFYDKNRQRQYVRLGAISKRAAETIKRHVENLIDSSISGAPLPADTAVWVKDLGSDLRAKLASHGLVQAKHSPVSAELEAFISGYIAARKADSPNTTRNLKNTQQKLVEFLGANTSLATITAGDADDWYQWLGNQKYAISTISKAVKHARQFMAYAVRKELISANPFEHLKAAGERNNDRKEYVDREKIQKVMNAAPDTEWRAIIALARYGGLRIPSELAQLRWSDIDWERRRFTFACKKTKRYNKGHRTMPLLPELHKALLAWQAESAPEAEFVITKSRRSAGNLRTQFQRIIKRAGVEPWPRLFTNLRTSIETDLADNHPIHVVTDWLGNTPAVAQQHYLQTTEAHFERAVGGTTVGAQVAQQWALQASAPSGTARQEIAQALGIPVLNAENYFSSSFLEMLAVPPRGVEPLSSD